MRQDITTRGKRSAFNGVADTGMDNHMEMLILVDKDDKEINYKEKESCHLIPAALHRAFSIFIVNTESRILIHKRQSTKKTWPGFWTNACCSHPRQGEDLKEATKRRLQEELGIACDVKPLFTFHYKADYDEKYGEHEIDHVFLGVYDGVVRPNNDEIQEHKFVPIDELVEDVRKHPDKYTPWFKQCLPGVLKYL
jgi:isopentenyl-diphosphate Delta-isomerase